MKTYIQRMYRFIFISTFVLSISQTAWAGASQCIDAIQVGISGSVSPQRVSQRFFDDMAKRQGFYKEMAQWSIADWYSKAQAKIVQALLFGLPSTQALVEMHKVQFIHPILPEWSGTYEAQMARSNNFLKFLPDPANRNFRDISAAFQNTSTAGQSIGGIAKGVRFADGTVILYDGNGRLFAYLLAIERFNQAHPEQRISLQQMRLEIKLIEIANAPPGTEEAVRHAQRARGGLNFDVLNPRNNQIAPNMTMEQAVAAYYDALVMLWTKKEIVAQQNSWYNLKEIATAATVTQRPSEGQYQYPSDMLIFQRHNGHLSRQTAAQLTGLQQPTEQWDAEAVLQIGELQNNGHYLFIVDSSGAIRIAKEGCQQGQTRMRKHGDLAPATLPPSIQRRIQTEADRLRADNPQLSQDAAYQKAILNILIQLPANDNHLTPAQRNQIDAIKIQVLLNLPPGVKMTDDQALQKARIAFYQNSGRISIDLTNMFTPTRRGPFRGPAKLGGDIVVSKKNGTARLKVSLNSSYSFARHDGQNLDTEAILNLAINALRTIVGPNIFVGAD